jgi:hypothetical protein
MTRFGDAQQYREVFDPGTGHAARRAELETDLTRLREDRQAGIYDRPTDADWFRAEYQRLSQDLDAINTEPERDAGMVWVPTGTTMGDLWQQAETDAQRRELLASYHVKAVVYPRGSELRVWIHSLDPQVEAEARRESWEAAQREQDAAFLARLQADQETEPDWTELAEYEQADQDAAHPPPTRRSHPRPTLATSATPQARPERTAPPTQHSPTGRRTVHRHTPDPPQRPPATA